MMDFTKLLQSLAKGEQPDLSPLITRRKNGPPAVQLTPSQTAVSNILQPAEESMTIADINRGETPSGGNPAVFSSADLKGLAPPNQTGRAVKGALGGLATGIHNSMAGAQPIAPAAFDLDPGYESRRSALMPQFGDGGYLPPGGGVDIQPVNNALAQSPDFSRALSAEQPDQQQPDQQQSDTVQPTPQASDPNAPNFDNFGWNSDSPEMKAQRENDLNREPTLDELRAKYMKDAEVHPNKWKDALFGALTGVNHAVNGGPRETRTYSEIKRDRRLAPDAEKLAFEESQAKFDQDKAYRQAQTQNIYDDNARQAQERQDLADYRNATIGERKALRESRDLHTKMRTVASMLSKVPNYDPSDPRFAAMSQALGDVGLPLTPKDVKKNIKLIQDADTGAWTLALTDPYNGQEEVRPVTNKKGEQLVTTSPTKVTADAAEGRQTNEHDFQLKKQAIAHNLALALEDHKAAIEDTKNARNDQQKQEAALRQEDARKRIAEYETNLRLWLAKEKQ